MLVRTESLAQALNLSAADRDRVESLAQHTAKIADGMCHVHDYRSLGAICCDLQPRRIFEIGTFLGTTSNFLLDLLPEAKVVSIAFVRPRIRLFGPKYNNSSLSARDVGSRVSPANRRRFHQLLGDSHQLNPSELLQQFGPFDLVFIDGDHSHQGVLLDTQLARQILSERGGIAWHDANQIDKYLDVRRYLEHDLPFDALAISEQYAGGVAYWHPSLVARGIVPARSKTGPLAA